MDLANLFVVGGLAEAFKNGFEQSADKDTMWYTRARLLELADHIDQMSSAINALEERVKKLEGRKKENV